MSVKATVKRSDSAFKNKSDWDGILRDVYEFALPMRNSYEVQSKGAPKMDRVFDSTAIKSTNKFASQLQSKLVPPFQRWATFEAGPLIPPEIQDEVKAKLQEVEKKTFAAIHQSNFDVTVGEFFLDLASGTAAMLVLEGDDDNPVNFQAVPNAQVAIDEGPMGSVDGVFRKHNIKIRNITRTWKEAKLTDQLTKLMANDSEAEVEVIEATFFVDKDNGYKYEVILKATKKEEEPVKLVDRKYNEHPWIVVRWIKAPGETWGRGPLMVALPDIKTLNKVKELVLKNASFAIAGVWTAADDGVLNPSTVRIVPGAVIPVASHGNGLTPLEFGGRFDVASLIIEDLQNSIRQALHDVSLPPVTGAVRSPTEIIERVKELQEDLGAPFGRMMSEMIRPLLQRVINILQRKGVIDTPIKVDGLAVKATVTSPLAKMQALTEIEDAVRWLAINKELGEQIVFQGIKVEDFPSWSGDKMGIDKALIRSRSERDQLQEMAGQAAAQGTPIPIEGQGGGAGPIPIAA